MIRQEIFLERYGWKVTVFYAVTHYETEQILSELEKVGCEGERMKQARDLMELRKLNTGLTFTNIFKRHTVMVINATTSAREFDNSLNHERQHLLMHIAQAYNMDVYDEEICYLAGDLAAEMHPVTKNLTSTCGCHDDAIDRMIGRTRRLYRKN